MNTPSTIDLPIFDIPRLPSVTTDDNAAGWERCGGGFRVDLLVPIETPLRPRLEFSAGLRLGWNDTGLLVLVEVTGREWVEAEKINELWKQDSVELYLAPYAGAPDLCQWLATGGMDAKFPEPRVFLHDFRHTPSLCPILAEADVASHRTATGYQLGALLPWVGLGIEPQLDREVGFQIVVNGHDRPDEPQDHLLWFPLPSTIWDSRKMQRLRLSANAHPPITARVVAQTNHRKSTTDIQILAPMAAAGQRFSVRTRRGELAAGQLEADDSTGYARAQLTGRDTDESVATLEIDGRTVDGVLLDLPLDSTPARLWSIDTRVRWESAPLAVVLTLPASEAPGYSVSRREPGQLWQVLAKDVPPGDFRDAAVTKGRVYEYAVTHAGEPPSASYFQAGSEVPLRDQRGLVLLLVERSQAAALAGEIRRLMLDLVGDGWQVIRHDVAASQTPVEIKELIRAEYDRAPMLLNTVFLLGHIPVPYSGNIHPDGHDDHVGAWPADVYYGALEGAWTDTSMNHPIAGRHRNVPGDGKFDQSEIPGRVQLAVGRVDFFALPAFGVDETTLLRRYLDRDHAYRQARLPVSAHAIIQDHFVHHDFAYSGWQNFISLLGPDNIAPGEWPNIKPAMNLLFYGCGPGGPESMAGFGTTKTLVTIPLNAVFTLLLGSYFVDWDVPNNLMRAVLATDGGALTCGWAGLPHWYVHPMGLGETIGGCLRSTQNNSGDDYQPTGANARSIHLALMGDPTLCLHRIAPPSDLRVRHTANGQELNWTSAPQAVNGCHVYRAATEFGPYTRLTGQPITACQFHDPAGSPRDHYMVRAIALQSTPTGSYYLASPGAFHLKAFTMDCSTGE